jgi:uncharacterized protein YbdZ (MbtH family)
MVLWKPAVTKHNPVVPVGFLCCWYYGVMLCDRRFSEHHSLGFPVLLVLRDYALWPQVFRAPFSWVFCAADTTGLCFVTAGFQSTILLGFLCCWYYGVMLCDRRFSEHHSLGFPVLLVLRGYALWPQVFRAPFSWVSCVAEETQENGAKRNCSHKA